MMSTPLLGGEGIPGGKVKLDGGWADQEGGLGSEGRQRQQHRVLPNLIPPPAPEGPT